MTEFVNRVHAPGLTLLKSTLAELSNAVGTTSKSFRRMRIVCQPGMREIPAVFRLDQPLPHLRHLTLRANSLSSRLDTLCGSYQIAIGLFRVPTSLRSADSGIVCAHFFPCGAYLGIIFKSYLDRAIQRQQVAGRRLVCLNARDCQDQRGERVPDWKPDEALVRVASPSFPRSLHSLQEQLCELHSIFLCRKTIVGFAKQRIV